MTEHKFNPHNSGVSDGILRLYFNDGDIILPRGRLGYSLIGADDTIIEYSLIKQCTVNTNTKFNFVNQMGQEATYSVLQLVNIKGIDEELQRFVNEVSTDNMIRIEDETNILIDEIMDFHVDNAVNSALDLKEFDKLKVLIDNGLI